VNIQLGRLAARLAERKIRLTLTDEAKAWLAGRGYDPQFGARPLKRAIQAELENPLAKAIIAGTFAEGDAVNADKNGAATGLTFGKNGARDGFPAAIPKTAVLD
jgi:ATP-dependent Clp protease ATP-binding subunit ClpB